MRINPRVSRALRAHSIRGVIGFDIFEICSQKQIDLLDHSLRTVAGPGFDKDTVGEKRD
jgi:hypothetical protein